MQKYCQVWNVVIENIIFREEAPLRRNSAEEEKQKDCCFFSLCYLGINNYHALQTLCWYPLLGQGLSPRETQTSWKPTQKSRFGSIRKQNYPVSLSFPSKQKEKFFNVTSLNTHQQQQTLCGAVHVHVSLFKAKKYTVHLFLSWRWENELDIIASRCWLQCWTPCWEMSRYVAGDGITWT